MRNEATYIQTRDHKKTEETSSQAIIDLLSYNLSREIKAIL